MLEAVQNRAACLISSNYDNHKSITQIKLNLSLELLSARHEIALSCLFHKYAYSNRPFPLHLDAPSITSSQLHNHFSHDYMGQLMPSTHLLFLTPYVCGMVFKATLHPNQTTIVSVNFCSLSFRNENLLAFTILFYFLCHVLHPAHVFIYLLFLEL